MKKNYLLFFVVCILGGTGCFSNITEIERNEEKRYIAEEAFKESNFMTIYTQKSFFALLPAAERKKYVSMYQEGLIEFFVKKMSLRELESFRDFQKEPVVKTIRQHYLTSTQPSKKTFNNFGQIIDNYPIIKKIASEEFQKEMGIFLEKKLQISSQNNIQNH